MTPAADRISLLGMRFVACHGVLAEEKVEPQPFEVDLVLHADLTAAGDSDDLSQTANYAELHRLVAEIVTGRSYNLVEALAVAIASETLGATDPRVVDAVEVRVRKPEAPIDGAFDTVEVSVTRRRAGSRPAG